MRVQSLPAKQLRERYFAPHRPTACRMVVALLSCLNISLRMWNGVSLLCIYGVWLRWQPCCNSRLILALRPHAKTTSASQMLHCFLFLSCQLQSSSLVMPAAFKIEVRTVCIFFRLTCNVFASFVVKTNKWVTHIVNKRLTKKTFWAATS